MRFRIVDIGFEPFKTLQVQPKRPAASECPIASRLTLCYDFVPFFLEHVLPMIFKDLLADLNDKIGLNQRAKVQAIAETYAKVVPEKFLKSTLILTIRNGVLEIEVSSAPLFMELRQYHGPQILKQLQESHPQIRDIRFSPAPS